MKNLLRIAVICLIVTGLHQIAYADTIKAAAMNACPYNCDPETDGKKGFMVELAERIFGRAGHTFTSEILPFNRAVRDTVSGVYDAIAICNPNDSEKLILPEIPNAVLAGVFLGNHGNITAWIL
jgi:polar amino acid transport system substrate-binding protein